jgi:tetratricopeptide (TPR) repeat protein
MRKLSILPPLVFLLPLFLGAQTAHMKKTILAVDRPALEKTATACVSFEANMQISFNSYDLYEYKNVKGAKPASMETIKELEKELKNTSADAKIFAQIADVYKRMKLEEEAESNRQKAVYLLEKVLEEHPDSVEAMYELASIHVYGGHLEEGKRILKNSLVIKPDYTDSYLMISMIYLFEDQYDSIYPFVKGRIDKYPDLYSSYVALSIHYFYNMYKTVSELDPAERILSLNTDSIMEMKLLYDYWQRDPKDFKREYLYRVCYQNTLNAFLVPKSLKRPGFDSKNVVFAINDADRARVLESEKFFKACLKNDKLPNKFLAYRILGNMYLLLDQPKKAIPCLRQAISLRPVSKSTLYNNADQEYDNLLACYFILKDSAACEKVMLEKISVNPAIDPNTLDYEHLGNYYIAKKKYEQAKKMYTKALELNYANSQALIGLAFLRWVEGSKKTANDFINKAYTADKNNIQVYCLSGVMALEDNDAKNAWEFFKIAKKLDGGEWIDKTFIDPYLEIKE